MTYIEIQLSKKRNLLMLAGALMFVVLGILFCYKPQNFVSSIYQNVVLIKFAGIFCIIFFGVCSIYGMVKIFDKKVGLTIDTNGITDNTNASSIGLINWPDITSIETQQVVSTRFLLVFVENPDKYLNRTTGLKRKLLKANMKMYGTPLSITPNSLRCNFDELEELLMANLNEFQSRKNWGN